ncbi:MAG: cytidine deaminase [Candidatus Acetothermia bacterium]
MTENEKLIELATEVRKNAYAPYSGFPVGAALLTEEGKAYTGTNVENGVNDLSICAERVALFKAVAKGEREFSKIAVVCESDHCQPCGACRQTLMEHAPELTVLMGNLEGEYETIQLKELLPEAFLLD